MLGGRVLLESAEGDRDRDRYSFLGLDPVGRVVLAGNRLTAEFFGQAVIDEDLGPNGDPLVGLAAFQERCLLPVHPAPIAVPSGGVGYIGYECVERFEPIRLREKEDPLGLPDLLFHVYGCYLVFDRLTHSQKLIVQAFREHPETKGSPEREYARVVERLDDLERTLLETPPEKAARTEHGSADAPSDPTVSFEIPRDRFLASVERVRDDIVAGEILQGVVAQGLEVEWPHSAFEAYRRLRSINPSPYLFYLDLEGFELFGASPEVLVRVRDGKLLVKPIAGTRRRPENPADEAAVAAELLADEKERAEHLMLVDLGRNDLGRVAKTGSVLVTRSMFVERFSHVLHLVSEVQADLADGCDAFDAIRATFPAGTVSGAPKIRAMQIVDEVEPGQRGPYAGLVGYFDGLGNFDSCITIRSAVCKDGRLRIRAGAGIVYDSVPEREYDETIHKASALLAAIGGSAETLANESRANDVEPTAPEKEPS